MKKLLRSLFATALLASASLTAAAQSASDTTRIVLDPALINSVNVQSFEEFRAAMRPLVTKMAANKVVAMGEGTHGTAEFYQVRFWLTRILMEEHGFTQVALENNYGATYRINEALQQRRPTDLKPLMQKHLLSIWQNRETAEMLTWLQAHNARSRRKLTLSGIDAMFAGADAQIIDEQLGQRNPALRPLTAQLIKSATYRDNLWVESNKADFKFDLKTWLANGLAGYDAATQLLQALPTSRLPRRQREVVDLALQNVRMVFDAEYQVKNYKRDSSRDSSFAEMTKLLVRQPGEKIIIWAHNAHVSRKSAYAGDNNGGGAGAFLDRLFPGNYFVLATSTASGTFAATTHNFISPSSPMAAYPLPQLKAGSWQVSLAQVSSPAFYLNTWELGALDQSRPERLVGHTVASTEQYANQKLSDAYDAMLFLRHTTAATPL